MPGDIPPPIIPYFPSCTAPGSICSVSKGKGPRGNISKAVLIELPFAGENALRKEHSPGAIGQCVQE